MAVLVLVFVFVFVFVLVFVLVSVKRGLRFSCFCRRHNDDSSVRRVIWSLWVSRIWLQLSGECERHHARLDAAGW